MLRDVLTSFVDGRSQDVFTSRPFQGGLTLTHPEGENIKGTLRATPVKKNHDDGDIGYERFSGDGGC